jgi:hypothetical protein
MSNDIFGKNAPEYWERNLPIVPCDGKEAIVSGWPGLLAGIPSEAKRADWIERYRQKNLALLTGREFAPGWLLVALDIDDDRLTKLILRILDLHQAERRPILSGKRGKKGLTIFVRASKALNSTVIKGAGGLGNIDFLAAGKMTVMPPSIHPDTKGPYVDYGTPLLRIDPAALPEITDRQIKLLKATIGSEYAIVLIAGEATHDAGVALVAVLIRAGATDEEITTIFSGLLPDGYDGDSLGELPEWIKSARDKGFDEQEESETRSVTKALVTLALNSQMVLFNDGDGNAFATLPHLGDAIAVKVGSSPFNLWLRHEAYKVLERPVSSGPLKDAAATLEATALFSGETIPVFARVAGDGKTIAVDVGDKDGRIVLIKRNGWQIEKTTAFKFIRGTGFEGMPLPRPGDGALRRLQTFLGLDDQNYRLLLAFLINALRPEGPYFILLVEGEQGSGKSFFCGIIKRLVDPNAALRVRLPDKPHDLMIQAKEYRLLSFDNASGMSADISDALCALATGGGFAVRKLYTDGDLYVMNYSRPFMINGIGGYANRPDLMERAIPIRLPPVAEGSRKTEAELLAEFEELRPGVLAALYDAVAHALRTYDEVEPPRHLRMADAARWIRAAEEGLDERPGAIVDAIAIAQNEFVTDRINDDPLVQMLRRITGPIGFEDYVGELFVKIIEQHDAKHHRRLPQSPSALSSQLLRLRPALAKAGIHVDLLSKDRRGRKVRIRLEDEPKR